MSHKLSKTSVRFSFFISIIGLVCFLLLELKVIQKFPDDVTITIKIVSVITIFIGLCYTFYEFMKNELQNISEEMNSFHQNHDKICDIGKNIKYLKDNDILEKINNNTPLVQGYIQWIIERCDKVTNAITSDEELLALESEHFRFANMIFQEAKNEIISTSIVNPKWYERAINSGYIEKQVDMIKNKKIKFTRIFFIDEKTDKDTKSEILNVIEKLLKKEFHIILSKTPRGHTERDVAIIDDRYAIEAEVPKDDTTQLYKAEYEHGVCYINNKSTGFDEVKRYLDGVVKARADNQCLSPPFSHWKKKKLKELLLS